MRKLLRLSLRPDVLLFLRSVVEGAAEGAVPVEEAVQELWLLRGGEEETS